MLKEALLPERRTCIRACDRNVGGICVPRSCTVQGCR